MLQQAVAIDLKKKHRCCYHSRYFRVSGVTDKKAKIYVQE